MGSIFKREIKLPANLFQRKSVSLKELVQFTRQAATLVKAGLPLVRSLETLHEQLETGYFKTTLGHIAEEVQGGVAFSEALSRYSKIFPDFYVNMVKAGEQGGLLDKILKRLADFLEKQERLHARIKSALMYPIFVLAVALIILVILMIFVVPTFTKMFSELGGALPVPTRLLLILSDTVRYRWYWIIGTVFLGALLLKAVERGVGKERWQYFFDNTKLKLPLFGNLVRKVTISRFARTLGTLLTSGVPILLALDTVKAVVGNAVVAKGIGDVRESIKEGESISGPLSRCSAFDPMVTKMVAIGEETGQLDRMLVEVADSYEEEVDIAVGGFMSLLEPLLIVVMGLTVGFIVIAMFMPLFSLAKLIS